MDYAMDYFVHWPIPDGAEEATPAAMTDALAWATLAAFFVLVPLVVLFTRALRRRRFWCPEAQREVEVELEECGLPGLRWSAAVRRCSVFDPPTAVACQRRCLDPEFRRRWVAVVPADRAA